MRYVVYNTNAILTETPAYEKKHCCLVPPLSCHVFVRCISSMKSVQTVKKRKMKRETLPMKANDIHPIVLNNAKQNRRAKKEIKN